MYMEIQIQGPLFLNKSIGSSVMYVLIVNGVFLLGHLYTPKGPSVIIDFYGSKPGSCLFVVALDMVLIILQLFRTMLVIAFKDNGSMFYKVSFVTESEDMQQRIPHRRSFSQRTDGSSAGAAQLDGTSRQPPRLHNRRSMSLNEVSDSLSRAAPSDELARSPTISFDVYAFYRAARGQNNIFNLPFGYASLPTRHSDSVMEASTNINGFRAALNWRIMRLRAQRRRQQPVASSTVALERLETGGT